MTLRNLIPTPAEAGLRTNRLSHPFLLGELLSPLPPPGALQVRETEEGYAVRCELPGYEREEVEVDLTGDLLEVRAAPGSEPGEWGALPSRAHSVRLTAPIDAQQVEAELKNGVLLVRVPKSEAARPRRIPIQTGRAPAPTPAAEAGA